MRSLRDADCAAAIDAILTEAYPQDMAQDLWTGIVALNGMARGWQFDGRDVLRVEQGGSAAEVAQALGDKLALVIRDGTTTQPVPARVLSGDLPFGDLIQKHPRGLLGAAARLCIAGVLAGRQNWDGVICLQMPDATHWCQISAEEIVSFQSATTPLLAQALGAAGDADPDAAADTMSRPERLAMHLRSAQLNGDMSATMGHLLGAELAAMRAYWLGQRMIVIGPDARYADLLRKQGVEVALVSVDESMRDGLIALRAGAM